MSKSISKLQIIKKTRYEQWFDQIFEAIQPLIIVAEDETNCQCALIGIVKLLQTCKALSVFLPLRRKKCSGCVIDFSGRRKCTVCQVVCTFCTKVYCEKCQKEGTLGCAECTCTGCKQSYNITGCHPGFGFGQQRLCYLCASNMWGSDKIHLYNRSSYENNFGRCNMRIAIKPETPKYIRPSPPSKYVSKQNSKHVTQQNTPVIPKCIKTNQRSLSGQKIRSCRQIQQCRSKK